MKPILIPTQCVHDWQRRLANPGLHWERGYSARTLATSWEEAQGLPPEIGALVRPLGTVELQLIVNLHPHAESLSILPPPIDLLGHPLGIGLLTGPAVAANRHGYHKYPEA